MALVPSFYHDGCPSFVILLNVFILTVDRERLRPFPTPWQLQFKAINFEFFFEGCIFGLDCRLRRGMQNHILD